MKYPKIPRELQKRCKLTDDDIREIRLLFKKGSSKHSLARQFNVSKYTIIYWVDEKYRQKDIRDAQKRMAEKRKNPQLKKLLNKQRAEEIREARARIPALYKYHKNETRTNNRKANRGSDKRCPNSASRQL